MKKKTPTDLHMVMSSPTDMVAAPPVQPMLPSPEKISDPDKAVLDLAKSRRELALANAKLALAQSESAELVYNNVVLQLALKYKLIDNDTISENGEIQRKSQV